MTTTEIKSVFTPEDLLNLPGAVNYELANGTLVERHMGSESSAIALAVGSVLRSFVKAGKLGHLFTTDCGYRCFPDDPDKVRKPDVSFVRSGRLPGERPPEGYILVAPDLVVEVLSPGDLAYEIDKKVEEYIAAGVPLIWVINPKTRTVRIHRPEGSANGPIGTAGEGDSISGETVLPGFECPVDEFFQI